MLVEHLWLIRCVMRSVRRAACSGARLSQRESLIGIGGVLALAEE